VGVKTPAMLETMKTLLAAANPGLATKDDLARLESKVDELAALVERLAAKLAARPADPRP
jgi:hypothetical protein